MIRRSRSYFVIALLQTLNTAFFQPSTVCSQQFDGVEVTRLARAESGKSTEPVPDDELLYRWQGVIRKMRKIAPLVGDERLPEANEQLIELAKQLPRPYNVNINYIRERFKGYLGESATPPSTDFKYNLTLGQVCCELGERDLGVRMLERGYPSYASQTGGHELFAFELTEPELEVLSRQVDNKSIGFFLSGRRSEIRKAYAGRTPLQQIPFRQFLGMRLAALDEEHRRLSTETPTADRLSCYQATIAVLDRHENAKECDAWRSKLLIDFPKESDAHAEVHFARGVAAYSAQQYEVAIATFQNICRVYPQSKVYRRARCNLGQILQGRRQYREATESYLQVFSSEEDEIVAGRHLMELALSVKNHAAHGLVDCYEALNNPAQALHWVNLALTKYPSVSFCGNCTAEEKLHLTIKQARLNWKIGKRGKAISILEPLVLRQNGLARCPASAALLLVDMNREEGQLEALERRLKASNEQLRAKYAEKHPNDPNEAIPYSALATQQAIAMARMLDRRDAGGLWQAIAKLDRGAYEILSDEWTDHRDERVLGRRAVEGFLSLHEEAGPLLLKKLHESENEVGWAMVLLTQMKHPRASEILAQAAAKFLGKQHPQPSSRIFRRDLCHAIVILEGEISRQLQVRYRIGEDYANLNIYREDFDDAPVEAAAQ